MLNYCKKNNDSTIFYFSLLIVTLIGAYLRLKNIDSHALWFDEGYTTMGALTDIFPWKDFLANTCAKNSHPPLEFILHHFTLKTFGVSDSTVRIVPCTFGILSIFMLGILTRKISNGITGICAALLLSFAPIAVYLSLEARYYSHLIFATIIYTYSAVCFFENANWKRAFIQCVATLYLFNVSLLSVFIIPFVSLSLFVHSHASFAFCKFSGIQVLSGLMAYLMYVNYGIFRFIAKSATSTSQFAFSISKIWDATCDLFKKLNYCYIGEGTPFLTVTVIILALTFALIIFKPKKDSILKFLLLSFLIAIPCIYVFASFKGRQFSTRVSVKYVSYVLPFMIMGTAYAIAEIPIMILSFLAKHCRYSKNFAWLATIISLSFCCYYINKCYMKKVDVLLHRFVKSDWKRVEQSILKTARQKKCIVASGVYLYGSFDPCQKIYFDVIPKQNELNIHTTYFKSDDKNFLSDFIRDNIPEVKDEHAELFVVTERDYNIDSEIGRLFTSDFGRHGSPAICVRKFKSMDYCPKEISDNGKINPNNALQITSTDKLDDDKYEMDCVYKCIFKSDFTQGIQGWHYWRYAATNRASIIVNKAEKAVRIENTMSNLCGLSRAINLVSGKVYQVEASARSTVNASSDIFFGARVALFRPGRKELQILWSYATKSWTSKSIIFTNDFSGLATLFFHTGYAKNSLPAEFKDIMINSNH